jgi:hypothetical protein
MQSPPTIEGFAQIFESKQAASSRLPKVPQISACRNLCHPCQRYHERSPFRLELADHPTPTSNTRRGGSHMLLSNFSDCQRIPPGPSIVSPSFHCVAIVCDFAVVQNADALCKKTLGNSGMRLLSVNDLPWVLLRRVRFPQKPLHLETTNLCLWRIYLQYDADRQHSVAGILISGASPADWLNTLTHWGGLLRGQAPNEFLLLRESGVLEKLQIPVR